ncbi:extracellular calcium-sensing receptor-like [Mantella aurantiaca]
MWTLVLSQLIPVFHSDGQRCRLDAFSLEGMEQFGDIMIGVVLPLHFDKVYQKVLFKEKPPRTTCTMFHLESFQQIQVLIFAVNEINSNPKILPNVTLGFQIFDSCNVIHYDLQAVLQTLTGLGTAIPNYRCLNDVSLGGVIGSASSTHSMLLAHILGLYRYPQVSHYSTSRLLSDKSKFPSFFRTVPSDEFQSHGLVKLLLHFGWTFVGLLAVDNDYGQDGIRLVRQEIMKAGLCVAFTEYVLVRKPNRNAPRIVQVIKNTPVNVIVVFSTDPDLVPVFEEMIKENITGRTFVASEGWSTSTLFLKNRFLNLSGAVGLSFYSGTIPGFGEFIKKVHPSKGQEWVKLFWEETFNCRILDNATEYIPTSKKECNGTENLANIQNSYTDVSSLRITNKVYIAVHVLSKALDDFRSFVSRDGSQKENGNFKPWQLLHYVKKVKVKLSNGRELSFDDNGDPPVVYDIVNWQLNPEGSIRQTKVGSFDMTAPSGYIFNIDSNALMWATTDKGQSKVPRSVCSESCPPGFRKAALAGQPVCCYECISCPVGEISDSIDALDCFKCSWDKWPNPEKTNCLQKAKDYLSYEESLGATLAVASALSSLIPGFILKLFALYKSSPIVKANNYSLSCLLLLSLSLCFLCSLVFIGYPQAETCLIRQAAFGLVFTLCVSCILAKTLIVVFAFMATRPGSRLKRWTRPKVSYLIIIMCFLLQLIICISWLCVAPPFPQYNIQSQPVVIIECNEGSPFAFWIMLSYLFLLATVSLILAFLARRLPDSFNEAQCITFSMLAFLCVWISFIPAFFSAQGKYTVATEIFAILTSSWALVICMFLPKCFIILFRSEMNTREFIIRPKQIRSQM